MPNFSQLRTTMVDTQVRPSDVTKFPIIQAMLNVPREAFVPASKRDAAYVGEHIDLGRGRVVLDPRVFAKMLEEVDIQSNELVLDLGAGLGYSSAVIAHMAEAVIAVEDDADMAAAAANNLMDAGVDNVVVECATLADGAPQHGPYDVVILQGAVETLPDAVLSQVKSGGRIVCIFLDGALGIVKLGYNINGEINWRPVVQRDRTRSFRFRSRKNIRAISNDPVGSGAQASGEVRSMTTKNTFKLRAFAALVAAGLGVAAPLSVSAESLGDALASAYKNSGLLEQNRATLRATDEGVATALASLRPTIGYSAGSDYSFTNKAWMTQLGFNASMTLYTFGKNKVSVDIAKETVLATREALINVEQQVLASAVATYMNVREQEALVNLRNSAVRLATQNLRATRDRFEVGEVTRTQVSQFEAQLASVRAQLASAQGTLAAARESYKNQMGHYPSNLSSPPSVKLPVKSADAAVRLAHRTHPGIKALQHQVSAADLAVDGTERNLFPEISASAGWSVNDNPATSRVGKSIGISASGPIYSGGAISSAIRKTIAQRDQSRAELLTATRDVEEGVRSNWAMLSVLRASLNASQAFVSAQRVAYNGVREEADLGASTALDVLDAEQDLLDAQVSAIQAQIASETQTYNVLQSMGLLTVQNLNLNVPVYDPAAYYNAVKTGPTSYVSPEGAKLDRVLESLGRK